MTLWIDDHQFKRCENDADGPCHPPQLRKKFWTDVLTSLELSYALLFEAACFWNIRIQRVSQTNISPV